MSTLSYKKLTAEIADNMKKMGGSIPNVMQGFGGINKAANAPGALDTKTKEIIALGIGISARCDGCIGFHTKALVDLGITREEFTEILGVAIYMGGGPSVMYAANAMAAYEEFSAK